MANSDTEVAIIGGGAAGVAAAHRLQGAGVACLIVEARTRLGGRALTSTERGFAMDLGCGWLHSAERNPWSEIAQQARTARSTRRRRPGSGRSLEIGFPLAEQRGIQGKRRRGNSTSASTRPMKHDGDQPGVRLSRAGLPVERAAQCGQHVLQRRRARPHLGARLGEIPRRQHELARHRKRLGATVEAYGAGLPVVLDCPVRRIDHTGQAPRDRHGAKATHRRQPMPS